MLGYHLFSQCYPNMHVWMKNIITSPIKINTTIPLLKLVCTGGFRSWPVSLRMEMFFRFGAMTGMRVWSTG